jgi:hypothetical protein
LPGRYRFYYLPRYHWLLTAEQLEGTTDADDLEQLTLRLAQANRFQPGALAANRVGQLTGSQKVRLLVRFAVYAIGSFIAAALFIVYCVRTTRTCEVLWLLIALVIGVIAVAVFIERKNLGSLVDYLQGRVLITKGPVTKDVEVSLDTVSYYYDVNETCFSVNEAGYEALVAGLTYRLYFLPRSQKLVNIEAVATEAVVAQIVT